MPKPTRKPAPVPGDTCGPCGRPHTTWHSPPKPACTGHNTRTGAACRKLPVAGLAVCNKHGAGSPAAKAKAARARADAEATRVLRRFGAPVDTSPTEALLDAVKWTAGYVGWLRDKVAATPSDAALVWGQTRSKVGGDDRGVTFEAGKNAWLVLLGEWHDRLVKICAEAIKAGIEERRVRLAEQQGQLVADVIRAILADLDLTAEQQTKAGTVIPFRLRQLAS